MLLKDGSSQSGQCKVASSGPGRKVIAEAGDFIKNGIITNGIGAEKRLTVHQPDDQDADQRRHQSDDAQPVFRRLDCRGHGAFGAKGEGREQNTLDRENEAERDEEIGHEGGAGAAGLGGNRVC